MNTSFARESLSDAHDLLNSIVGVLREPVLVVDASMRIVAANVPASAAFARRSEPLEGLRLSEVFRDSELNDAFSRSFSTHAAVELKIGAPSADDRTYDINIAPLDLGTASLALGTFYDVTRVERLEKVRQEFLSNISHELRTPLTSILAFVETLEDGALTDPENNRRFLNVIRRNAERMNALVSDILELSLIESGRVTLAPADVRLRQHVDNILGNLSAQAAARSVEPVNMVPEDVVVHADARRLEQMLTNLIDNAIKFNREAGSVTVCYDTIDGRHLITVSDEGEGIMPGQLGRIFERFYRADRARTSGVGGTGLGLAIVKHLAKLHGGEISAISDLGRGSRFAIELPAGEHLEDPLKILPTCPGGML